MLAHPSVGLFASSCFALLIACGGEPAPDSKGADAGTGTEVDANNPGAPDAAIPANYTTLIDGTWSKTPGSDSYHCSWLTVQEDTYITGFEALSPNGTHHTVLSVVDDYSGADKEEACDVGTIAEQMLFASGVGTDAYQLPAGVAIKVSAGQTLMLNVHLFNIGDSVIEGTSGTMVTTAKADEVEHLAEFIFAGTPLFSVPGNGVDYTVTGSCTMPSDGKVFALWPHMHQVGKHMTISYEGTELLDTNYDFNEQKMYPITEVSVQAGKKIDVTCTWNNNTGVAKGFGDESTDEMCFGGVYRYPASSGSTGICYN